MNSIELSQKEIKILVDALADHWTEIYEEMEECCDEKDEKKIDRYLDKVTKLKDKLSSYLPEPEGVKPTDEDFKSYVVPEDEKGKVMSNLMDILGDMNIIVK